MVFYHIMLSLKCLQVLLILTASRLLTFLLYEVAPRYFFLPIALDTVYQKVHCCHLVSFPVYSTPGRHQLCLKI